jgi:hypothetical protein
MTLKIHFKKSGKQYEYQRKSNDKYTGDKGSGRGAATQNRAFKRLSLIGLNLKKNWKT